MLRSIEEIRNLKIKGKYKWGKDLITFLAPYFDADRSNEEVIALLSSKYQIELDVNELKNLKFRYRKPQVIAESKILKNSNSQEKYSIEKTAPSEIEQKQELKDTNLQDSFNQMFGDDNIVEKQKRERDALFETNTKGAKW